MKNFRIIGAALTLLLFPLGAHATQIKATYTVNAHTSDPGLVINTENVAPNAFSYDLAEGEPITFELFDIWATECCVNTDDIVPQPISVDFGFLLPEIFSGSVDGATAGDGIPTFLGFILDKGKVNWNGPLDFFFGSLGDGHIQISLSDETFNEGFFDLGGSGATVEATLSLIQDPTVVPEPDMLVLFGLGILGMVVVARRRRSSPGVQAIF